MTATNAQVRIMMRERQKGKTLEQAAASANVRSRKTVARYERMGRLPSALKQRRNYRTRHDPFVEHWPQVESMLAASPELEAKALFGWLCEQYPGRYVPFSAGSTSGGRCISRRWPCWNKCIGRAQRCRPTASG